MPKIPRNITDKLEGIEEDLKGKCALGAFLLYFGD
jgi:hypothetical protein